MSTPSATCPKCGAALPPEAPAGLCPRCLLEAGLASQSQAAGDPPAAQPTTGQPEGRRFVPLMPAELASAFPQLEILELLGSGGMGAVYKARHPHLDRLAALKILPPQLAEDPAFEERFSREARALAKLNHPHIVTVYDFGETSAPPNAEPGASVTGKLYYLLMEYVDGTNLRQVIQRGQLKPEEALAIVPQLCEALQYAHDRGVVHRDIKPENILLDRQGRVKIADFGLAKMAGQPPAGEAAAVGKAWTLTATGQVMGTPHYMAPEQLRGTHDVDHRADIYSLGVVFYEMLTNELPIGKFEPPSRKVQVDVRLDEVVLRTLESNPERRYQQASEVKTDVETISRQPSSRPSAIPAPAGLSSAPTAAVPPTEQFRLLLVCAIGMVFGGLMMAAGVAVGVYALLTVPVGSGGFWSWMGGALGCFLGGGGSLLGSWNSFRQLAGAGDLLRAPGRTWLDYLMWTYTLTGIGLAGAALAVFFQVAAITPTVQALLSLGGMMVFQGILFLVCRGLMRQPGPEHASDTSESAPAPAGPFSVLGRAWKQWWMERSRWLAQTVQAVLLLGHLGCLLAFISFHGTTTWDAQGRPQRTFEVGFSGLGFSPWFKVETWPDATTAFRWNIFFSSSSCLFLVIGLVAHAAAWQIEKALNPNAGKPGFWRTWRGACVGSPATVATLWTVLALAVVGFGAWFTSSPYADWLPSLLRKLPVATVSEVPPTDAEKRTPGLEVYRYNVKVPAGHVVEFFDQLYVKERQPGKHPALGASFYFPEGDGVFELRLQKGEILNPDLKGKLRWDVRSEFDGHSATSGDWMDDPFAALGPTWARSTRALGNNPLQLTPEREEYTVLVLLGYKGRGPRVEPPANNPTALADALARGDFPRADVEFYLKARLRRK